MPGKASAVGCDSSFERGNFNDSKAIECIVHGEPFQPYRLVLDDGEQLLVTKPRKSQVSGDVVSLLGESRRDGGASYTKFRIVPIKKIVSAEHVSPKQRRF